MFVMLKTAVIPACTTVAPTAYGPPRMALAVKVDDVATPLALLVAVFTPPANVPLGPFGGTINVTTAPATGLFCKSATLATRGAAKGELIGALCGVPLIAVINPGVGAGGGGGC